MPKIDIKELPDDETYLIEDQIAERAQTSKRTVQSWRLKGGGPDYVKFGTLVRYPSSRWKKFQQENLHSNTSEYGT